MNHPPLAWYNDLGFVANFFTSKGYKCVLSKTPAMRVVVVYWQGVQQVTFHSAAMPVTSTLFMDECLRLADTFRAAAELAGEDPDLSDD